MDTTKDVTDYDQPSLVTPQPVTTFNQTAHSAFGKSAGPAASDRDTRMKVKHEQRKQLNKTFTDFQTSTINQADKKKKGFLANV